MYIQIYIKQIYIQIYIKIYTQNMYTSILATHFTQTQRLKWNFRGIEIQLNEMSCGHEGYSRLKVSF